MDDILLMALSTILHLNEYSSTIMQRRNVWFGHILKQCSFTDIDILDDFDNNVIVMLLDL